MNARLSASELEHLRALGVPMGGTSKRHGVTISDRLYPLWCVCSDPQTVTAYGWAYCGRCQRGYNPETTT